METDISKIKTITFRFENSKRWNDKKQQNYSNTTVKQIFNAWNCFSIENSNTKYEKYSSLTSLKMLRQAELNFSCCNMDHLNLTCTEQNFCVYQSNLLIHNFLATILWNRNTFSTLLLIWHVCAGSIRTSKKKECLQIITSHPLIDTQRH